MAQTLEQAQAAVDAAQQKLDAATAAGVMRDRIAASQELANARRGLTEARNTARQEAAAKAAEAEAARIAAAEAARPRTPAEMAANLMGVAAEGVTGVQAEASGFRGYTQFKPITDPGVQAAFMGYNPETGTFVTREEQLRAQGGYNPYEGAVGYQLDPNTGNMRILLSNGNVMTTGARYEVSGAGFVKPILNENWTAFRYNDQGIPINAQGNPITPDDVRTYNDLVGRDPKAAREFAQGKGIITAGDTGSKFSGTGSTGNPLTLNGTPFTGSYNNSTYKNGVLVMDSTGNTGGATRGTGSSQDPLTVNGIPFSGILGGVNYANGVAQNDKFLTETDIETKARRTAQQDFKAVLGDLGLGDLADEVDRMIKLDFTVSQIKMELPKTESYIKRFPGMKALRDAGRAINEATYIANERAYTQTLRAYGLDTAILGSRSALGTYIANEVSPREFEERVNLAATRVKENPDVMSTFKTFYPEIDQGGVIAYMLNPKAGLDIIKKQIRTSEIGAAAVSAGFAQALVSQAEAANLVSAVGESSYAQIATEFKRARQLSMNQRRLAQIEGQQYSDLEAIGAVVGDNVQNILASERRAARETARFAGAGGLTAGSLREASAI